VRKLLEQKLFKSGEASKLRQIHGNDLQKKIQNERELREQLQKLELQVTCFVY
jgi:hypothetical protein